MGGSKPLKVTKEVVSGRVHLAEWYWLLPLAALLPAQIRHSVWIAMSALVATCSPSEWNRPQTCIHTHRYTQYTPFISATAPSCWGAVIAQNFREHPVNERRTLLGEAIPQDDVDDGVRFVARVSFVLPINCKEEFLL